MSLEDWFCFLQWSCGKHFSPLSSLSNLSLCTMTVETHLRLLAPTPQSCCELLRKGNDLFRPTDRGWGWEKAFFFFLKPCKFTILTIWSRGLHAYTAHTGLKKVRLAGFRMIIYSNSAEYFLTAIKLFPLNGLVFSNVSLIPLSSHCLVLSCSCKMINGGSRYLLSSKCSTEIPQH